MDDRNSAPALNSRPSFARLGRRPKVLWIASAGGHLAQAHRIEGLIGRNPESVWLTFDVPQSRSLLDGRRVEYTGYVAPRDLGGAIAAARRASAIASGEDFDIVVSTGAAIAGVALPWLALRGRNVVYVESISRSTGPSLTGRVMARAPRVRTFTQYRAWASKRWTYVGSVLDELEPEVRNRDAPVRRIFVTLGTIRPYRFDRAVDAVLAVLEPDDEVVWQLGATERSGLPGHILGEVPSSEMERRILDADVVVTHSGVGSILTSLDLGVIPVVVVRRREHGEHVDDHQQGIADVMRERGLAYELLPEAPSRSVLVDAATHRARGIIE